MAHSRYCDCLFYGCTSLESLPFCSELGERSPLGHSGDLQFFWNQFDPGPIGRTRPVVLKETNFTRSGLGLRFGFEVVVKPIQHSVVPELRVLGFQNPMTFVRIDQQL